MAIMDAEQMDVMAENLVSGINFNKVSSHVPGLKKKRDVDQVRKEKLKLASYCPKVWGCSWDHGNALRKSL